jgi:hypothetical protein
MGKRILFVVLLLVPVFALSGVAYAWQGRMGGMGDPFGLVADESDYLIHPAKIANGEGVRFYGDYRFTFTGVTKWDDLPEEEELHGKEFGHNALIGAAFPWGPGRMGLFFTYDGMRGDYDGPAYTDTRFAMKNNLDNFTWRLMYGLPVGGGFKIGAEAALAYRNELQRVDDFSAGSVDLTDGWIPYPWPHDSSFLEALFKGSMEGKIGPVDVELTLRGGVILPGTNSSEWNWQLQQPPGTPVMGWNTGGDVHGWQVGGDLWLRYALASDLTLPILVRADYQQKSRSGFGPALGGTMAGFQGEVKNLAITIGGGLDKAIGKETRIASGIYYNFLQGRENFTDMETSLLGISRDDFTFPDSMEHQVLLRLVGEHVLSPTVTVRGGLNLFYGWVIPEFKWSSVDPIFGPATTHEGPGHGYDWGILASLGGTVVVKPLTFEPFVSGGWRQRHEGMKGVDYVASPPAVFPTLDTISRDEWLVSSGLSILFDL